MGKGLTNVFTRCRLSAQKLRLKRSEQALIRINIVQPDVDKLETLRRTHPSPIVRRRAEVLFLKAKGLKHQDIVRVCGISRMTLTTYLHLYRAGGVEAVSKVEHQGQPSTLNAHTDVLKQHFRAHPPQTVAEAQAAVREQTGITRSPTQIRALLKRLGLRVRTTASLPAKVTNPDKQAEQEQFKREQLEPRLEEVRQGKRSLFS